MQADMQANMANGGRWDHIASEMEIRRALRDKNSTIYEVPAIGITLMVSRVHLTTLRAGAAGGDIFCIEGGWVYANDLLQRFDEMEIRQLAENTSRA
jgi:2-keto-3-deoxy-6-phosphogluconate aldolase